MAANPVRSRVRDMEVNHVINPQTNNGLEVRMGARGEVLYFELRVPRGKRSVRVETVPGNPVDPHSLDKTPLLLVVDGSTRKKVRYRRGEVIEEGSSKVLVDPDIERVFAHRIEAFEAVSDDIRSRIEALASGRPDPAGEPSVRGFSSWLSCMSDSIGTATGLGTVAGAYAGGVQGAAAGAVAGAAFGSGFGLSYCTLSEVVS